MRTEATKQRLLKALHNGPLGMPELIMFSGLDSTIAHYTLQGVMESGLVESCNDDHYRLTPLGRELVARMNLQPGVESLPVVEFDVMPYATIPERLNDIELLNQLLAITHALAPIFGEHPPAELAQLAAGLIRQTSDEIGAHLSWAEKIIGKRPDNLTACRATMSAHLDRLVASGNASRIMIDALSMTEPHPFTVVFEKALQIAKEANDSQPSSNNVTVPVERIRDIAEAILRAGVDMVADGMIKGALGNAPHP